MPDGRPGVRVELDQLVDLGRIDAPASEGGLHRSQVVAHQPDIDHDGHNGSVTTRGRWPMTRWARAPVAGRSGRDDRPAVSCDGVVVRYGETVAVDRLSFEGRAGEVVALLGPNGAGKTSTVEALEGYRPVAGGLGPGPRPRPRPPTTPPWCPASG